MMNVKSQWSEKPDLTKRFLFLFLAAVAIMLLLLLRLWYLQVISAERFQQLSEKNRIRYIPISAPRGPVYDRDGHLLVDNRPSFSVSVMRQDVSDRDQLLEQLSEYLEIPVEDLARRWEAGRKFPYYRPVHLAEDISREQLERVQENSVDLPGVLIDVQPLRSYPYEDVAAHVFGYLGEITEEQLRNGDYRDYRSGEYVGKSGLEKKLESYLKGKDGQRLLEVDVRGKELRVLRVQEPEPGNRVFLTLREDVQLAAEKALTGQAGAAVAIDVDTGEILAMASRPSFNPAIFARGISGAEWISLLQDSRHPLQNKALTGQYPPASTFKIVTALAALRAGAATAATRVDCDGHITLGRRNFRCWKRYGHGPTDLKKAMRESCDVWFYRVGLELGIDKLSEMALELGLGNALGFDLGGEKSGLVPTRDWKRARFNAPWYDGETVNTSIGQGFVLATPLQLATMTATVANGGSLLRPHIIKKIESWDGEILLESDPEVLHTVDFPPNNLKIVQNSLEAVVNEQRGTGWAARLDQVRVAGKTGTAQVIRRRADDEEPDEEGIPYRFRDHALFVAYAPAEDPRIAVAVIVEHGEHGSTTAAPVARSILQAYFGLPEDRVSPVNGYPGD